VPAFITPFSAARRIAVLTQTDLINSVMKLFKFGFAPNPSTVKAELDANICDFTNYVDKNVTAWAGPTLAPSPGYQLTAPVQEWTVIDNTIGNTVGGYWIEDAAGNVMQIVKFDDPGVSMNSVDDAVIVTPTAFFTAAVAAV
jgi:hypothetical protein